MQKRLPDKHPAGAFLLYNYLIWRESYCKASISTTKLQGLQIFVREVAGIMPV